MIHVGTSGFFYDDWPGTFYPPRTPKDRMFDCYREWFDAVEINATFYGVPPPTMMRRLVRLAAGRVRFAAKMSERVTHHGDLSPAVVGGVSRALEPAAEAGALGAVLLQFPHRFHETAGNRRYLLRALEAFRAFPLVVEIRHDSWQSEGALSFFRERRINLCVVDMPRLGRLPRTIAELTGPIGYVRFHGRNGRHWFKDAYPGAPYDYEYSGEELRGWVEPMRRLERKAETTFAFFNNHLHGQAPKNAREFSALLLGRAETAGQGEMWV